MTRALGVPRLHLRVTDSTNARARELASRGAVDGTLVTAAEQTAGRGRQGRSWTAPPGRALLCSIVIREPPELLSLVAGVAVADAVERVARVEASLKWPNDVLVDGRKLSGILVEGRPQERWAVAGIGINIALREHDFPDELRGRAATLGLDAPDVERVLAALMRTLERWLEADDTDVLAEVRRRDFLLGREVAWSDGRGTAAGIDDRGRLLVATDRGHRSLDAGEVHLAGVISG